MTTAVDSPLSGTITVPPVVPPLPAWRMPVLALLSALAAVLLLYRETATAMVTIWVRSETFTHAFIVPPIVLWLVWRRRHDLSRITPVAAPAFLIPIALVGLAWLMGDLTGVNSVTQLALVTLLVLTVPAVLGWRVAYAILFPLCFMYFSVPIGEFLMPVFMEWTADFTVAALRWTGVPVLREGLQFVIPSGNWSVVEACSGIRYLIASVTVGALFAHLNYQSAMRRVLFAVVSILVPVFANWVRAYMIVMLGHLSGNKLAVGVDHLIYGWVFFGVVIMLMFVIGARWAEAEPVPAGPATGTSGPFWSNSTVEQICVVVTLAVVLTAAWPLAARWLIVTNKAPSAVMLQAPAVLGPGWEVKAAASYSFKPNFENPSAEINTHYQRAGSEVGLYIGFYRDQDYTRKLVSSNNVLVMSDDRLWNQVAKNMRPAFFGASRTTVRNGELRRALGSVGEKPARLVVWQVYWINGTLTTNDYAAKVYSAIYRLTGQGDDSAVIVVHAEKTSDENHEQALESFMAANFDSIDALLRKTKAAR